MLGPFPIVSEGAATLREMHDDPFADTRVEQRLHGFAELGAVELFVVAHAPSGAPPGLEFVHDAVVHMPERGHHDFRKPVAVLAHAIHRGLESGSLRLCEHFRRDRAVRRARCIEPVEQQQVAEVENALLRAAEIEMRRTEQRIRAAGVEKRAASRVLHRHHVGEAGRSLGRLFQTRGVDAVPGAKVEDPAPVVIVPDEAGPAEGKFRAEQCEIHEDVER